jgi:hypothetical protein
MEKTGGYVRHDKDGNTYCVPGSVVHWFDVDCDKANTLPEEDSLIAWIDVKEKYKKYMLC